MAEIPAPLEKSIAAFRRMENIRWDGSECLGDIELTEENCSLIRELDSCDLIYPPDPRILTPAPGTYGELQLQPPRKNRSFFARDLEDLLRSPTHLHQTPKSFFLAEIDEIFPSDQPASDSVKGYLDAVELVSILTSVADHPVTTEPLTLIFLHKEKLEIPILYKASDLRPLPGTEEMKRILDENIHQEQRRTIFKRILLEDLKNIETTARFKFFIQNIQRFVRRFLDNYELYVSDFSFEKVFEQLNEKKLDYVLKLNKNFSDMQNQLLAIPIAALLAGTQMKPDSTIKNSIVVMASFVFSLFLSMLLRNQFASLKAIGQEINNQKETLLRDHAALSSRFSDVYDDLDNRQKRHKRLLRVVDFSVAMILVAMPAILLYFYTLRDLGK